MKRLFCFVLSIITIFFTFSVYAANLWYAMNEEKPYIPSNEQQQNISHNEQQPDIPRFDIKSFRVEGNTKLDKAAIDFTLANFTGEKKDFGTIQEAMEALEAIYHERGYTTVQVTLPEQELKNGIIRLVIIEARITSVKVEGNKFFDEKNIRRSIPSLREGEIPDMDKISNSLKVANEHPAKKISMQLKPVENEREIAADLKVVDEKAWKVSLMGDNTGNDATGVYRAGVLLQYNNLFNLDHLATLQYITSPKHVDKVTVLGFGYRMPLYAFGDSIDLYASYSDIDSGTIYAGTSDIQVSGRGVSFGARYNQNLARIGRYEHKISYGLDYRKYRNNATVSGTLNMDADVTVHPASLTYAGNFQFNGGQTGFNMSLIHNIPGGTDGQDEYFQRVRAGASTDYTIFRYGANFIYAFPADIQLRLLFNGQYTNDPLIPGEQFGLGGASSVRGFQEREVSDDRGNSGTIELYSPDICKLMNISKAMFRMLVFYDVGEVSRVSPLPSEESYTAIASVGPGARLELGSNFSLATDYGYGINVDGTRAVRHSRWHLMAIFSF
jgi:hemolysin activation/secretion protein